MKNMQAFYIRLTSSNEALDHRLPTLTRFSMARVAAAASEIPWYWWDAPQPIVTA